MMKARKRVGFAAVLAATALALSSCSSSSVDAEATDSAASSDCGAWSLAMSPWVGYTASAAVLTAVAEEQGCTITQKDLKEEIAWQGFETGEVDVIIEDWDHADLVTKYVDEKKVAVAVGPNGNKGIIGYFVPPWLAAEYPEIVSDPLTALNENADLFKNSESGSQGAWLEGDPTFVTNGEAIVKNRKLNFKVIFTGSEAALIEAFRAAEANKTAVIGYFYTPQWFLNEVPLVQVKLPQDTNACGGDAAAIDGDCPEYILDKIASKKLMDSGDTFAKLVQNFSWTNEDQNQVAADIESGTDPAAAAQKWIDANPDVVAGWLK
jgi:glycine betaine/proline transport system substrate-binding protein